jgi:hypothetical protein
MARFISHDVLLGATTFCACTKPAPAPSHAVAKSLTTQSHPGYRRAVIGGEERFSRNDPNIGSHIQQQTVCHTAAHVQAREDLSRDFMENIDARSKLSDTPVSPVSPVSPLATGAVR